MIPRPEKRPARRQTNTIQRRDPLEKRQGCQHVTCKRRNRRPVTLPNHLRNRDVLATDGIVKPCLAGHAAGRTGKKYLRIGPFLRFPRRSVWDIRLGVRFFGQQRPQFWHCLNRRLDCPLPARPR
jgi:hypothetical protein